MVIRLLKEEEYEAAIDLKISCWDEELAGVALNQLNKEKEVAFLKEWISNAHENNDIRLVYGAFSFDEFIGFAGASIAEEYDSKNGIELNYLFVKKDYRGRKLSLKLIHKLLSKFPNHRFKNMIVYNHHYAPSNQFYLKLGGRIIRTDVQGSDHLKIDVFSFDLDELHKQIERKLFG